MRRRIVAPIAAVSPDTYVQGGAEADARILAGFLNLVPLFGSIGGGVLPALVALTISPVKALEVVVLYVFINQVEATCSSRGSWAAGPTSPRS